MHTDVDALIGFPQGTQINSFFDQYEKRYIRKSLGTFAFPLRLAISCDRKSHNNSKIFVKLIAPKPQS